ncbi:conserved hypothetical protein [Candidatus Competibacter denitrificans Run_A_D11]|uniref:UPF0225 protein BN873_p10041 n=1 Tax=Candidatus Competibacter denitrificans Run_A_D11 TaxID=1400863 RepID=W6MA65_9GAMM|nr:YchJ family metal-binding protein [Candidatus Competibacter denitrificans]CDI04597.1 conserved hypothetical protein [Candidatus Competibacter denitrificans Run_A_D11]
MPTQTRLKSFDPCPCGAKVAYTACCGRYLDSSLYPNTAEALMRSRYVAYVRGRADYLLQTWHPSTRPASLDLSAETGSWLGLKVLRVEAGGAEDVEGLVEFVARYKVNGRAQRLREVSRFIREECRWFYREAEGTIGFPSPS